MKSKRLRRGAIGGWSRSPGTTLVPLFGVSRSLKSGKNKRQRVCCRNLTESTRALSQCWFNFMTYQFRSKPMHVTRRILFSTFAFILSVPLFVAAQGPLQFVPLTPCRLVDTRITGNPIQGGTSQNFAVQGVCGVPVTAAAYSLNVTVVPHGPLEYLTIWPAGENRPVVSTLNS